MPQGIARVLGWLVIAHGLWHAVWPLRGSLTPTMTIDDWIPVGLYAIGMVGFVAAGLGLVGLRPLDGAISPLLVLASGLSLVAIIHVGDWTLWFGGFCDAALLLIGLWRGYGGWSAHPPHGRRRVPGIRHRIMLTLKSLAQSVAGEELGREAARRYGGPAS